MPSSGMIPSFPALISVVFSLHSYFMASKRKQVTRMLAVGNAPGDQIRRLTRGEAFTCCYGSEAEHSALTDFCLALQSLIDSTGQRLEDLSPEELRALIRGFGIGGGAA